MPFSSMTKLRLFSVTPSCVFATASRSAAASPVSSISMTGASSRSSTATGTEASATAWLSAASVTVTFTVCTPYTEGVKEKEADPVGSA